VYLEFAVNVRKPADTLALKNVYRVAQKNGASVFHCKYFENSTTELRESELLQYCMLNAVITFLFKTFVALWHHLAKT